MQKVTKVYKLGQFILNSPMPIIIKELETFASFLQQAKPSVTYINATLSAKELGLDGVEKPLRWLDNVLLHKEEKYNILLIQNFFKQTDKEQMKFYELLKYRRVLDKNLPENCIIIIEGQPNENNKLSEIIASLLVLYTE